MNRKLDGKMWMLMQSTPTRHQYICRIKSDDFLAFKSIEGLSILMLICFKIGIGPYV